MDILWAFREAYEHARKLKVTQDEYCVKATRGDWTGLGDYPEDLQWEALVDVLRGRVKVRLGTRYCQVVAEHILYRFIPTAMRQWTWMTSSG